MTPDPEPGHPSTPSPLFIDISHFQPVFPADTLRTWTIGRLVVKLGGANNAVYESDTHRAQVAAAHSAGIPADRYWFNGVDGTIPRQIAAIRSFLTGISLRPDEFFVWDIENEEDAEGVIYTHRWTPAQVAQAAQLLADLVPLERQRVYCSDSLSRSEDWSAIVQLGLTVWVASYGINDGTRSSVPLVGHWPTADLWQYTSVGRMPGYDDDLDLNTTTPLWTVHALQASLNVLLGDRLMVDGDLGADTARAVRTYQTRYGLLADGDPGTKTLTHLTTLLGGVPIYQEAA